MSLSKKSFLFLVIVFLGCERQSAKRIYEEVVIQEESPAPIRAFETSNDPHGQPSLAWSVPEGWIEKPGSGMRLASFANPKNKTIDVSIVSLSGSAGGLMANVNRWMEQLGGSAFHETGFQEFLQKQKSLTTQGKLPCLLIDFTSLQSKDDPSALSMLAGVVELPTQTIFLKMTGALPEINQNREALEALCQSLKFSLP